MSSSNLEDYLPKVSICVVTYNQDKYIRACLESLINQDVDFKYEIIVGDDASTDSTISILKEMRDNHPDKIKLVLRSKNVGTVQNCLDIYRKAKGRYICHMDGDDLAYPGKLATQAGVLDANQDCNICSHNVDLIDCDGRNLGRTFKKFKTGSYGLEDLLDTLPFFAHSSKMFRNDLHLPYWNNLDQMALDVEVHVEQAILGRIYHIDCQYGAYRTLTGVTVKNKEISPHLITGNRRLFEKVMKLPTIDKKKISKSYARSLFAFAYQSASLGNNTAASKYILDSIKIKLYSASQIIFGLLAFFGLAPLASKAVGKLKHALN